jgi:hypothetical protein
VWELQEIVKILKAEVDAREASILLKTNEHKHDNRKYGDKPQPGGGKDIATGAFLNNSNSQPGNIICVYCSKQHFSASCKEVNDVSKRRDILMRDRRCFMCLKKGHRASNCERTTNCCKCNKRHHQSICNLNKVQQERDPNSSEKSTQQHSPAKDRTVETGSENTATFSVANFVTRSAVVLQTATAIARETNSSKTVPVRILFDGGSQRSYITKNLRDRLGLNAKKTETLNLSTFGDRMYHKQDVMLQNLNYLRGTVRQCVFLR